MVRYKIVQEQEDDVVNIELQKSGNDVDLLINGILVAWFDKDGSLCFAQLANVEAEQLESVGIQTKNLYIKTGRY